MIRWTVPVAVLAAVVLVASGCGGSKKSASPSETTTTAAPATTTTSSSNSGTTTTSTTSTTSSSGGAYSGGSTSGGSSSSSGSSGTLSKSCLDFASAASKLGQALAAGASPTENADSLKTYFNGLAAKAPSDIKASFQVLATAISKYVDEIKKLNIKPGSTPSATDIQKLQSAVASIGTPAVQAASDKIQAWVKAGCHS